MPRKIIIDTDPGIDDAMAIFYALASPELDVIGLTTVFGNAPTPICTTNALRLLEIAGRSDIPVAQGAQRSMTKAFHWTAHVVHGTDAQGDVELPAPQTQPIATPAAQFIVEQIERYPGEITLVPIGPLTNIALALMLKPDIAGKIQEIVLMGGNAFVPGNITPAAEANIYHDPEAADFVFGADCPITMIGLDVTHKVIMSAEVLTQLATLQNPRAQHLGRIVPFYQQFYRTYHDTDSIHVHDSTTVSYLLAPSLFETVQYPVCVDMSESVSRGKTWPGAARAGDENTWSGRRSVNICIGVDARSAVELELERHARSL